MTSISFVVAFATLFWCASAPSGPGSAWGQGSRPDAGLYDRIYSAQIAAGDQPDHARAYAYTKTYQATLANGKSEAFARAYARAMMVGQGGHADKIGQFADQAEVEAKATDAGDPDDSLFDEYYVNARLTGHDAIYAAGMGWAAQGWLGTGGKGMTSFAELYAQARGAGNDDRQAMAMAAGYIDGKLSHPTMGDRDAEIYVAKYAPFFSVAYAQARNEGKGGAVAISYAEFYAQTRVAGRSEAFAIAYAQTRSSNRRESDAYAQYFAAAKEDGDNDQQAAAYAEAKENGRDVLTSHAQAKATRLAQANADTARSVRAQEIRTESTERSQIARALAAAPSVCLDAATSGKPPCDFTRILTTYRSNEARFNRDYKDRTISIVGTIDRVDSGYITIRVGADFATCWPSLMANGWEEVNPDVVNWNPHDRIIITGTIETPSGTLDRENDLWISACKPRRTP